MATTGDGGVEGDQRHCSEASVLSCSSLRGLERWRAATCWVTGDGGAAGEGERLTGGPELADSCNNSGSSSSSRAPTMPRPETLALT